MNFTPFKRLLPVCAAAFCLAQTAKAEPTGVWMTEGNQSHIKIESCGDSLCGTIVWFDEPRNEDGSLKVDAKNMDHSLRTRPVLGLQVMSGFVDAGGGKWIDGKIYNPQDGATYRSELEVIDASTLKVSGCVFIFCLGQDWKRLE